MNNARNYTITFRTTHERWYLLNEISILFGAPVSTLVDALVADMLDILSDSSEAMFGVSLGDLLVGGADE